MTKTIYLIYQYGSEYQGVVFCGYTTIKEKARSIVISHNKNNKSFPMFMKPFVLSAYCMDDYDEGEVKDE